MALLRRKTKKKLKKRAKKVAKRYWPLGVTGLVLLVIAAAWAVAPTSEWIAVIGQRVQQLGWAAPLIYFLLYVIGTLILVPSPVMAIAGGVAFGWWGLPLALVSEIAGCACSFLLSRYFFGDTLENWLSGHPMFRAVKHAVEEEGWRALLLLRLSPAVPPSLLNYLLGITAFPFGTYLIWTTIGNVPSTVLDIYIGVLGANAHDSAQLGSLVVGLIATIALVVLITIKAKGYLRKAGVKS